MSAYGTKQTLMPTMNMSAFRGKADIPNSRPLCLLMTQGGHPTPRRTSNLTLLIPPLRSGSSQRWNHQPAAHGRHDAQQHCEAKRSLSVIRLLCCLEQPSPESFRSRPRKVGERHDGGKHRCRSSRWYDAGGQVQLNEGAGHVSGSGNDEDDIGIRQATQLPTYRVRDYGGHD